MFENALGYTLIKADRVIDGEGGYPIKKGAVLIRDGDVIALGNQDSIVPDGKEPLLTFEYPGMTLMPGLVDAHTHHNGFGDGRPGDDLADVPDEILTLQSARNARLSLFSGVTTIRENGPKNATTLRLRDALTMGTTVGPKMVLCGQAVAIIGGHMSYFGIESTGLRDARAYTRQLIKEGADYIKITATGGSTKTSFRLRPSFNIDELSAIVDEAHKFGKLTAAHCTSTQGISNSLDAGVDMIIHCVFKEPDDSNKFRKDLVDRIGEQEVFVNPTLHVSRAGIWSLENKKLKDGLNREDQTELDNRRREFEHRLDDCRRMIDMGVKVVTGSDSSWGDYPLGNTHLETECLVMAGYSPMQALLSVTRESASSIGVGNLTGTLKPGKRADMIIVDGNPDENIPALSNVVEVFLDGNKVDRGNQKSLSENRQLDPNL